MTRDKVLSVEVPSQDPTLLIMRGRGKGTTKSSGIGIKITQD